jgi:hypothetical protein
MLKNARQKSRLETVVETQLELAKTLLQRKAITEDGPVVSRGDAVTAVRALAIVKEKLPPEYQTALDEFGNSMEHLAPGARQLLSGTENQSVFSSDSLFNEGSGQFAPADAFLATFCRSNKDYEGKNLRAILDNLDAVGLPQEDFRRVRNMLAHAMQAVLRRNPPLDSSTVANLEWKGFPALDEGHETIMAEVSPEGSLANDTLFLETAPTKVQWTHSRWREKDPSSFSRSESFEQLGRSPEHLLVHATERIQNSGQQEDPEHDYGWSSFTYVNTQTGLRLELTAEQAAQFRKAQDAEAVEVSVLSLTREDHRDHLIPQSQRDL